jgi:hypothetical protein
VTFEAYISNIKAKTGKSPEDFHALAKKKGLRGPDAKAMQVVTWLKKEFGLGHGHAMAIWAVFTSKGWVEAPAKARRAK